MKKLLGGSARGQKLGAEEHQWQLWWEDLPVCSTKVASVW